jgi:hypothetical protein
MACRVIITASKLNNSGTAASSAAQRGSALSWQQNLAKNHATMLHGPVTAHTPFLQNHQHMYLDLKT